MPKLKATVKKKLKEPGYRRAFLLVLMFGVISLFSNMDYQASRSLNGSFLGELGASAIIVGLITGLAEFLGFSLRLLTGFLMDKSRAYWGFTFVGYSMLVVVPLMALADTWELAAVLIILERISKAVRVPAKDTILSMAARRIGTGYGFGIQKTLDQMGGISGPLVMSLVLSGVIGDNFLGLNSYKMAYSLLWIPFVLMCIATVITYKIVPKPEKLEEELHSENKGKSLNRDKPTYSQNTKGKNLSQDFWIYSIFTALASMGFINFTLLGYHANATHLLSDSAIPFYYALAMAGGGVAAFFTGKIYDKLGFSVMYVVPILSIPLPFLGFLGDSPLLLIVAIFLFGVSLGIQETIAKAAVADLTPLKNRGLGYGVFNAINGVGVLASGVLMGYLYTWAPLSVCIFATIIELGGLFVLMYFLRKR